ncbi:hypothetical protein ACFLSQ_08775 [Bacteroidota bacterium]
MKLWLIINIILLNLILLSCNNETETADQSVNSIAEHYVKLVLATGKYDKDYVDAYFGPEEWKVETEKWEMTLEQIKLNADSLISELDMIRTAGFEEMNLKRLKFLRRMIQALSYKAFLLLSNKMTFDEESKALFDAVAPSYQDEKYVKILNELEKIIPGDGALDDRFIEYKKQFIIPADKVDTVFKVAIEEGKRRTLQHIKMPDKENFILEYVRDKSWGGYNWFKGDATSLIQVNIDLPKYINGAVGLACHEGYPGHHVYHSLIEVKFVKKNGWMEFTVYPLFSPEALLSEGTANFGIEVVFQKEERMKYEKEVLFPLAGLSSEKADEYYKILELVNELSYASVDVARSFLDGKISREEAVEKIMKYKLRSRAHAEINVNFFEQYRSYIINYYMGEELCRNWVESRGGTPDKPEKRWELFIELLSAPFLPSDLVTHKEN